MEEKRSHQSCFICYDAVSKPVREGKEKGENKSVTKNASDKSGHKKEE